MKLALVPALYASHSSHNDKSEISMKNGGITFKFLNMNLIPQRM